MSEQETIRIDAKKIPYPIILGLQALMYNPEDTGEVGEAHQIINGLAQGEKNIFSNMPIPLPVEINRGNLLLLVRQFKSYIQSANFTTTNQIQTELLSHKTEIDEDHRHGDLVNKYVKREQEGNTELDEELRQKAIEISQEMEARSKADEGNIVLDMAQRHDVSIDDIEVIQGRMECMKPVKLPLKACIGCFYGFFRSQDFHKDKLEPNAGLSVEGCDISRNLLKNYEEAVTDFEVAYLSEPAS